MNLRFVGVLAAVLAVPAFADSEAKGTVRGDDVHSTVTVDPFSLLGSSRGLNIQLERAVSENVSAVIGAGTNGFSSGSAYGVTVGGDLFLMGRRNEGLSVGPRLQVGLNDSTDERGGWLDQGVTGYRHAVGAELGYHFISNQGITVGAGAGLSYGFWGSGGSGTSGTTITGGGGGGGTGGTGGYIVAPTTTTTDRFSDRFSPYALLNVGLSW